MVPVSYSRQRCRLLSPRGSLYVHLDWRTVHHVKALLDGVNAMRSPDRSMLIITHYQRLLGYIEPDFVHVLANGRIVASGGKELAQELEASGYAQYTDADAA